MNDTVVPIQPEIDPEDVNPLICSMTADTLNRCADVIDYLAYFNESEAGEPNDNIKVWR